MNFSYKSAGVDVEAGYRSVELIKKHAAKTATAGVLSGLGGFGGLFDISKAKDMKNPALVSGTDGVGTKLKIAFLTNKHDTIGIDCVAMCVNDVICCGAEPLFFLDYIACGKNYPERIEQIVKGVSEGCILAQSALIGGETAEMPDFYDVSEYDIAGFSVGIVDREKIIDGKKIQPGDKIIGVASSGLHSNGYSLVRKVLRPSETSVKEFIDRLNCTLGEELLRPTKIYVKPILDLIKKVEVLGISNITGGGFVENIPRAIPSGLTAKISKGTWEIFPIFKLIQEMGSISEEAMYNTFNMGVGMTVTVRAGDAQKVIDILGESGEKAYIIGEIESGNAIEIV
ncbi:phosphoribosylformylglycinamidine cyclo-ligase [Clostridia bacterium]|nr:phosphoribosylformylglycinamidine cyclo-ligase [Clostridia bacterium]